MGQMNIGNLFAETGCGIETSRKTQQTSSMASSQFFKNTLNGAKTSFEGASKSNEIKKTSSKDPFKPKLKEYSKSNDIEVTPDKKVEQQEVEEESNEYVDENQILMLMSQGFNLAIDEIQKKLEELGLEVKDLTSQEGFSVFISDMYGQGSIAELLINLEDVKDMTALFEQLSSLQGEILVGAVPDNMQQTQVVSQQQEQMLGSETQEELNGNNTISVKEINEYMGKIKGYNEKDETSNQNLNLLEQQQNEEIEFTMPSSHFTTTFVQKFETASGVMTQTTTKTALSETMVMEQIDFKVLGQTKEINLQLSPKELGDLNIKIIEHNSALVAEIKVDNDKAKDLILSELHQLKESLENQGLTITDVKVDIRQSNQKSQMEQERQKSSKRIQEIVSRQLAEVEKEEKEESLLGQMASEIDYMV